MTLQSVHDQTPLVPSELTGGNSGKTRSACNRCHQQKLRCIKTKEKRSCERCEKLKIECRYSPRERRGVRNKLSGTRPTGPGTTPSEPRNLAPAIAPVIPAISDMQKSVAMVPGNIGCDWFSFLTTEYDNAEGQGCLNSGPLFPPEVNPDPGPGQPVQLASTLETHIFDHDEGATHRVASIYQNITNEKENNHSFGLLNSHDISGFSNGPSYGLIGHPLTSTTGRLTGLNMALYECARKLPSIKASREEPVISINASHTIDTGTREAALLALDDVFTVTTEFINVMQTLCPTTGYHEIPITTTSTSTTRTSRLSVSGPDTAILHRAAPHGLTYPQPLPESSHQPTTTIEGPHEPDISSPVMQPFPRLDEATSLLFLSCHCRLAEIYESLFQAIRRCIEGPHRTSAPHPPAGIILPQLQVGGFGGVSRPALRVDFSGPRLPPATVSMYLALTITLSSQLWAQVRETMLGGIRRRAPEARLAMAGLTWDTAMERTDNLSRTIEAIQTLL